MSLSKSTQKKFEHALTVPDPEQTESEDDKRKKRGRRYVADRPYVRQTCQICHKFIGLQKSRLVNHLFTVHGLEQKPEDWTPCPKCGVLVACNRQGNSRENTKPTRRSSQMLKKHMKTKYCLNFSKSGAESISINLCKQDIDTALEDFMYFINDI